MNYKTIYGVTVEGVFIKELAHTIVVKTKNGDRYLVHKKDTNFDYPHRPEFDLRRCQRIGKQLLPEKGIKDLTIW
ncbi:hypothetical protein IGI37_003138 [Enterococcus sp. AZ194]|uniref:hypothetical protein n=1 Tax=Enterococcus sp. AZ194 TaxID=2774629 RepID=UPI003F235C99